MQRKHDTTRILQKQFEFAGREFKLLSNSLNYKVTSKLSLSNSHPFRAMEFIRNARARAILVAVEFECRGEEQYDQAYN